MDEAKVRELIKEEVKKTVETAFQEREKGLADYESRIIRTFRLLFDNGPHPRTGKTTTRYDLFEEMFKELETALPKIKAIENSETTIKNAKKTLEDTNQALGSKIADVAKYKEELATMKKEFEATNTEVNNLIDPAATATVAGSYKTTKKEDYKKNSWAIAAYYALFLGPLIFIVGYLLFSTTDYTTLASFLKNISVILPCYLIAWFGLRSINRNKHMHDEYNHKQRVMETYMGFKKYTQDSAFTEKLNTVVVDAVAENPNKKPNNYFKPLQQNKKTTGEK